MDRKITITQNVNSPEIRGQIWKIYEQSFAGKELECAQNQRCYDAQTFETALTDSEYVKYYLEINGKVIAYMLSTNNLEKAKITYMNPERYFLLFPEYAPDRINYCTSLAVLTEYKESKAFQEIMSEFLNHIFNIRNGMLAFDFAHETMAKLPKILQLIWKKDKRAGNLEYTKVGAQEFSGMVLKKSAP